MAYLDVPPERPSGDIQIYVDSSYLTPNYEPDIESCASNNYIGVDSSDGTDDLDDISMHER